MAKPRVFISFDFDNDEDLKHLLVGQAKNSDSPFDIVDASVKEPLSGDWKEKVRRRLRNVDQMIVICGYHTDTATGVNAEIRIARDEGLTYFLLGGRSSGTTKKPSAARDSDKKYKWTWDNLKTLIKGGR